MELDASKWQSQKENGCYNCGFANKTDVAKHVAPEKDVKSKSKPFESYQRRTTVVVRRKIFLDVVCDALAEYKHVDPNQRADLLLACRIREKKESVTMLLCETSGCGKSTLSALLPRPSLNSDQNPQICIVWDFPYDFAGLQFDFAKAFRDLNDPPTTASHH
ncbi:hypothetical protein Vadar_022653 [Vaccinium darrowii]|uniref:Uncharacterized protein n=1 Tax=Vaccinium darrowii TaxID=229202 RepID=A0ACB7X2T5_9ERIC|nr:hypothetical protein Vadar_022653 [Vaccinium darrowii]